MSTDALLSSKAKKKLFFILFFNHPLYGQGLQTGDPKALELELGTRQQHSQSLAFYWMGNWGEKESPVRVRSVDACPPLYGFMRV